MSKIELKQLSDNQLLQHLQEVTAEVQRRFIKSQSREKDEQLQSLLQSHSQKHTEWSREIELTKDEQLRSLMITGSFSSEQMREICGKYGFITNFHVLKKSSSGEKTWLVIYEDVRDARDAVNDSVIKYLMELKK